MISATIVANSILLKAKENNFYIKPIRLYYYVYFLYSSMLYKYGVKLFNEPFSVTEIGPIVPSIYCKFNCYGNKVIKSCSKNAMGVVNYIRGETFNECVEEIIFKYKDYSDKDLYNLIVKQKTAYKNALINNNVLNDSDILNDEINIDEEILRKAKTLKNIINNGK